MAQSFGVTCLVTVLWMIIGYSLAFTGSGSFIGSLDRFMLHGMAIDGGQPAGADDPRERLHVLPDDLRHHHARR